MPSSVIVRMCYEPLRRELMIEFRASREVYRYFDVSNVEWLEFLEAESKGTHLNSVFKQKEHRYEKTDDPVRSLARMSGDVPLEWGEPVAPRKTVQRVQTEGRSRKATA
jgi:KTSC domain